MLTYRELRKIIDNLPKSRLDDNVSVHDPVEDEFLEVADTSISTNKCDVLDEGHLVLNLLKF